MASSYHLLCFSAELRLSRPAECKLLLQLIYRPLHAQRCGSLSN